MNIRSHLSFGRNGFNLGIYADHFVSQILATRSTTARIYPSLRDCRHIARISDSKRGARRETQSHGHCMVIAFATPAFRRCSVIKSAGGRCIRQADEGGRRLWSAYRVSGGSIHRSVRGER